MEEFIAQQKQAGIDQDQMDDAARRNSPRLAAGHVERSLVTTLREKKGQISEMVGRKLA